jgi:RNA polymerase-binding transcription factor DksA
VAHLKQCKDCNKVYKSDIKKGKYCKHCAETRESIRITRIKISQYAKFTIEHKVLLDKLEEQFNDNTKGLTPDS